MADKCYTCRFCKIDSHGSIYCSLRAKGGKCYEHDSWESQEDVLDKIRAEIEPTRKMYLDMNDIDWLNGCDYVLSVIDKYKAESEEK